MNILVVMDTDAKQRQWFETAAKGAKVTFCPGDGSDAGAALEDADVIIGNIDPQLVSKAKHLKWLQLNSAGAGSYCKAGILPDGVALTDRCLWPGVVRAHAGPEPGYDEEAVSLP